LLWWPSPTYSAEHKPNLMLWSAVHSFADAPWLPYVRAVIREVQCFAGGPPSSAELLTRQQKTTDTRVCLF